MSIFRGSHCSIAINEAFQNVITFIIGKREMRVAALNANSADTFAVFISHSAFNLMRARAVF